jgi:hypothetical protein
MQDFILVTDFKNLLLMKKYILYITACASLFFCCKKESAVNPTNTSVESPVEKNYGPFGKVSYWKCIGGDTIFQDTLSLIYFYTEKATPCDFCYYQQNISFWNDYCYTYSVSACTIPADTLTFTDIDSHKKTIFKHLK